MLIISFDAVGDSEFEVMERFPAFSAFVKQSAVFRDVPSVFLSNTYPIHASVATGVTPDLHGVASNTEPFPTPHPFWNNREDCIKAKTIWQAAFENSIDTAAVFWPVTAGSGTIIYNIPEVKARPGKSQIITSLKAGSKGLQMKLFLRYKALLDGIEQPNLDAFATACMADILRKHKPGLALIHLTAYDSLCHKNGKGSAELQTAFESLDRNLAILLEAAGDGRDVIVFSDHSQINIHTILDPNAALVETGLLRTDGSGYAPGESGCFIECCGGSAFFHSGRLSPPQTDQIRETISQSEGFRRFLTEEEMQVSGRDNVAFGFCAKEGYCYEAFSSGEKANHGYPLDTPDYKVFYAVRGSGFEAGSVKEGGSLLDIAPMAARSLGFEL